MSSSGRKLFLQEYIGLVNRLETLTLAFAIQQAHGHEILLDWPELDALTISGTRTKAPGLFGRWGALRLRECSTASFEELCKHRKILLRTYLGPSAKLDPLYRETIGRIGVRRHIVDEVRGIFAPLNNRPIIGVHIRRGDYPLGDPEEYDTNALRHPAVPLWWYEQAMARLLKRHPNAAFYLSFSGSGSEFEGLRERFDIVQTRRTNPYRPACAGHRAEKHPVVDLFALACCPVLLATPLSSFSYYAANLLGPGSVSLFAPQKVKRSEWAAVTMGEPGGRLEGWTSACRTGSHYSFLSPELGEVSATAANTDWLSQIAS